MACLAAPFLVISSCTMVSSIVSDLVRLLIYVDSFQDFYMPDQALTSMSLSSKKELFNSTLFKKIKSTESLMMSIAKDSTSKLQRSVILWDWQDQDVMENLEIVVKSYASVFVTHVVYNTTLSKAPSFNGKL